MSQHLGSGWPLIGIEVEHLSDQVQNIKTNLRNFLLANSQHWLPGFDSSDVHFHRFAEWVIAFHEREDEETAKREEIE